MRYRQSIRIVGYDILSLEFIKRSTQPSAGVASSVPVDADCQAEAETITLSSCHKSNHLGNFEIRRNNESAFEAERGSRSTTTEQTLWE